MPEPISVGRDILYEMADAYAQELCMDAMHDGTLKQNLARAYGVLAAHNKQLQQERDDYKAAARHSTDWADQAIADLYEYRARFEFLFHALPFEVRHRWGGDVQEFLEGIDAARGKATT
jgi:hypothetical protein